MNDYDAERWSWGCVESPFSLYLTGRVRVAVCYLHIVSWIIVLVSIRTRKREKPFS